MEYDHCETAANDGELDGDTGAEEVDDDDDIAAIAAPLHHLHVRLPGASFSSESDI